MGIGSTFERRLIPGGVSPEHAEGERECDACEKEKLCRPHHIDGIRGTVYICDECKEKM